MPEKRRKGKHKRKDRKKHPYKRGGKFRSTKIEITNKGKEKKKKR